MPLADKHLELELDSDPEVMRYLTGRTFVSDDPIDGAEQGEVDDDLTRAAWLGR